MTRALTNRDIQDGFWYWRPKEDFPPEPIQEPEEFDGRSVLNIACTQTGLTPRSQAKLVRRWCELLPTLKGVEFLWFCSKVTQELFDAACSVPGLQGLYVKWSGIKSIEAIATAKKLAFFHLGSSTQLVSIEPLVRVKNLIWLEVENIKRIQDLGVLGKLKQLQGLAIEGSIWTTQRVDSLAPLAQLRSLRHLSIANLRAKDKTLRPLFSLSSLELFCAANWWSDDELEELRRRNPKVRIE